MELAYRSGQIISVWLLGALCGVVLYSTIRQAEAYEADRARNPRTVRSAPRANRGIDASAIACGWVSADRALALGLR